MWSSKSALLSLCLFLARGSAEDVFPEKDKFLRAAMWRATAIDDYIYIDGGEVSELNNLRFRASNQINATLSIDCTSSWKPEDVEIRQIDRPRTMPVLSQQTILTDRESGTFYVWGGYLPWQETADFSTLWRFSPDGDGGGSWNSEAPADGDSFSRLNRSENSAHASAGDVAFIFGGKTLTEDGKLQSTQDPIQGFKIFNFTTKDWEEVDGGDYSQDGSIWGGSATFVDGFGDKGVVIPLGGLSRPDQEGSGYIDWGTIHAWDIAGRRWLSQKASGDIPPRRSHHCAVGIADLENNESAEIFVYGGGNRDQRDDYGTVHVLSLPGFTWTLVNDEERRNRTDHACVNVGGNSQLVSLGGINFQPKRRFEWDSEDHYPQGIAIFDMNSLSWVDSYDAAADAYSTHEDIRSWYENGGLDDVEWSDDNVRAFFTQRKAGSGEDSADGDEQDSDGEEEKAENEANNGADQEGDNTDSSSPTPVGAIAGGVVGGIAGVGLVGAAIWFFRRRRHKDLTGAAELGSENSDKSPPPPNYASELGSGSELPSRSELHSPGKTPESYGPVAELGSPRKTPETGGHYAELGSSRKAPDSPGPYAELVG